MRTSVRVKTGEGKVVDATIIRFGRGFVVLKWEGKEHQVAWSEVTIQL